MLAYFRCQTEGPVQDGPLLMTRGVGTATYASPEQLKGTTYNEKCDMYSLGMVMFELFWPMPTGMERYCLCFSKPACLLLEEFVVCMNTVTHSMMGDMTHLGHWPWRAFVKAIFRSHFNTPSQKRYALYLSLQYGRRTRIAECEIVNAYISLWYVEHGRYAVDG